MTHRILPVFFLALAFLAFFAGPAAAEDAASPQALSAKLDRVLEKLDEIKAELEVVKVRATLR